MKAIKISFALILVTVIIFSACAVAAEAKTSVTTITLGVGQTYSLPSALKSERSYNTGVISVKSKTVTALKTGFSTLRYLGVNGKSYLYRFSVKSAPSSIKLNTTVKDLYSGSYFQLSHTLSAGSYSTVTYSVDDETIATVNAKGKVYAKAKGTAVVTATTANGKTASCTFNITDRVTTLELPLRHINLPVSGTFNLEVDINEGGSYDSVTWKSSDTSVAAVKGSGRTATITAKKKGKATVTVSAADGVSTTCTVDVTGTKTTDTLEKQINSLPLYPTDTGIVALDKKVQEVFKSIFKSGYTTYDKVKAIYDYEIANFSYEYTYMTQAQRNTFENPNNRSLISSQDRQQAEWAYTILVNKTGVCYNYASLFTVMTRAIGLECFIIFGDTTYDAARTTWGVHKWNTILINGRFLVFDAQVDDNITNNLGRTIYERFGMTESEATSDYKYDNADRFDDTRLFKYFESAENEFGVRIKLYGGSKTWTYNYTFPEDEYYYDELDISDVNYRGTMHYTIDVTGHGEYDFYGDEDEYDSDRSYCIDRFYGTFQKSYYNSFRITDVYSGKTLYIEID